MSVQIVVILVCVALLFYVNREQKPFPPNTKISINHGVNKMDANKMRNQNNSVYNIILILIIIGQVYSLINK